MKKIVVLALVTITSFIFYSCKKSNTERINNGQASTEWVFNGVTYSASSTTFTTSNGVSVLAADGAQNNYATIVFNTVPTSNGTYTVIASAPTPPGATECYVTAGQSPSSNFFSTGASGTVTVTVSGGLVTATLSNVSIKTGNTVSILSGTLIQTQ